MGNEIEINDHFQVPGEAKLPEDILFELQSILRLHSMTPQELFYKWESYCIKMGPETKLSVETARTFKKDIQDVLDSEARNKVQSRPADKRSVHATPRAATNGDDVFGMFDSATPKTPYTTTKRKEAFETPASKSVRSTRKSSPGGGTTSSGTANVPFSERQNAGTVVETINGHLNPAEPPTAPFAEPRIAVIANSDISKFKYRPLALHLSEASEILDDRIDEFTIAVQKHHQLDEAIFGNPASRSNNEIVAVGRIASDTPNAKLTSSSLVLEASRRMGAGLRTPLRFDPQLTAEFFPGQIVAFKGSNTTGDYFTATEVLTLPLQPPSAFSASTVENVNQRLGEDDASPLNLIISAGPYTADDNLNFEPLKELCSKASETSADVLILVGPFLDIEHPLVATGDFDLPDDADLDPDIATLSDVFRVLVGEPLKRLAQENPAITILLVPSTRDAVNKHVSWPQAAFDRKGLGLPGAKRAMCVPNPVTLTINDFVIGISAQDILWDLRKEEAKIGAPKEANLLTRLSQHIIGQGHFYPLFPPVSREDLPKPDYTDGIATGTPMDTAYLKLGEFPNVRPDLLILPSALPPYLRATEGVFVVNPGTLSKRKGPGTYTRLSIHPRKLDDEELSNPGRKVGSRLYDRARADVIKI